MSFAALLDELAYRAFDAGSCAGNAMRGAKIASLFQGILSFIVLVSVIAVALPGQAHAAALNIVVIGASNTTGWGVGAEKAFPAILQTLLRQQGVDVLVTSAGVIADTTSGMLRRVDRDVPNNTDIVILQPGTNDLRFFGSREQRSANISAIADRLRRRKIRLVILDPVLSADLLQWDGIHYTAAAHAKFAATLAAQIAAKPNMTPKINQKRD